MLNPLDSSLFYNKYSIKDYGFGDCHLVLSMLFSKGNVVLHYLLLKHKNKEKYLICGFDFIRGSIIPIEIINVGKILRKFRDFIKSEYNTVNLAIEIIGDNLENYEKRKIKHGIIEVNKGLSLLVSKQRNIISGNCEVFSDGEILQPDKSFLITNRNGLLFGKIEFGKNRDIINDLKKIHLSEDFIIRYNIKGFSTETVGTIYELKKGKDGIIIVVSSFIHELSNKKMDVFSFQGSSPQSPVHAILRSSGILKSQIKIEGFAEGFAPYLVLIPIEDLLLDTNEFGFGETTFITKDEALNRYKGFKEKYKHNLLGHFETFAQTIVESDNAFDAYLLGRKKIQNAINMIILLSKNDRVFNVYNLGNEINEWSRMRLYQNPNCSSCYYVENIISLENMLGDSKDTWENKHLVVNENLKGIYRELKFLEEKLYKKQRGQISVLEKQIFNALKWLNRSWKAEDIEDKVIYTVISLEFLVNKIETTPPLPKDIFEEFKKLLNKLLKENNEIFGEYSGEIKNKSLGILKSVPIRNKVRTMIEKLGIPLTDDDFDRFWNVRKYRNDLVHGSDDVNINSEDILFANLLMGEFIVNNLKSMQEGD